MCLFRRPPLGTRRCLFLETLFSAIRGVLGARVTPGSLLLPFPFPGPPPWVAGPGPPAPASGLSGARCPLPSRGPGLGQELAGWARAARKLESFVLAPRPTRRGEEGGERRPRQGGLGRGRPRLWRRPRASSGFPAGAGSASSPRRAKVALLGSPRARVSYPSLLPFLSTLHTSGSERNHRPTSWGGIPTSPIPLGGGDSVCFSVKWGKERN